MKEIKFRMYFDGTDYLNENPDHPDAGKKFMIGWERLINDIDDPLGEYFKNRISGCSPLMQYTGMLDSNNVEIYEGDILLDHDDGTDHLSIVKFIEGSFLAVHKNDDDDFYCLYDFDFKVVGNILENPELLKSESNNEQR